MFTDISSTALTTQLYQPETLNAAWRKRQAQRTLNALDKTL